MTVERDLSRRQAEAALAEVARLRSSTRRAWGSPWFALVCFGSVTVIAAAALAALGPTWLIATWVFAGAAALLLTREHYRRRGRRAGVTGRGRVAWRASLAAFGVCFAAAVVGGDAHGRDSGIVASILVVLAAYIALGSWQRRADAPVATVAAAIPALALAALATAPWLVELTFGVGLIAAGASLRMRTGAL